MNRRRSPVGVIPDGSPVAPPRGSRSGGGDRWPSGRYESPDPPSRTFPVGSYPGEEDPPTRTAFLPGQSGLGYGFLTDGTGIPDHGIHGTHGKTGGSGSHPLTSFPCDPCDPWSESLFRIRLN